VITNHARLVVVGTGAVILTARHIPAAMMLTAEIDLYADGVADPEPISDLIDATIGHGSMFHRTFCPRPFRDALTGSTLAPRTCAKG
jgi:hypothetical protein